MTKSITITAGHSNVDPGAVNTLTKDREADIVIDMRNMVSAYLRKEGITVLTDGDNGINQPLNQAVKLVKSSSIAVEFHCNASSNPSAKGIEALSQVKDKVLAQALCKAVASVTGSSLRGTQGWQPEDAGQHSRLAYVSAGGIILELFFISNPEELATWKDKKWLVAKAVAQVLIDKMKG